GVRCDQHATQLAALLGGSGAAGAPSACLQDLARIDPEVGLGAVAVGPVGPVAVRVIVVGTVGFVHPAAAQRDVGLHQAANIGLGEEVVTAQRVRDACGGLELPSALGGEVGRTIRFLADLAEAARQFRG